MSAHSVRIITIDAINPHPNAERLEIIPIGQWQAVARKGQFKIGDHAVYIEPDYTVPTAHPAFAFLAKSGRARHRLKAVRLRGELSFGLLIEVPPELAELPAGTDVMATLGIERYEPPVKYGTDGHEASLDERPKLHAPKFDIEGLGAALSAFDLGEQVVASEKVHGANAKFVWHGERLHLGSRTRWLKPDSVHLWSQVVAGMPSVEAWCRAHPNVILFGEVYGQVQSLTYGLKRISFAAFAAYQPDGTWMNWRVLEESLAAHNVPMVPVVYRGPLDIDAIKAVAETNSRLSEVPQMMEGVVIVPANERSHPSVGRVAAKHISTRYWTSDA